LLPSQVNTSASLKTVHGRRPLGGAVMNAIRPTPFLTLTHQTAWSSDGWLPSWLIPPNVRVDAGRAHQRNLRRTRFDAKRATTAPVERFVI
jgi:hypothetical protein